MKAVTELEAVKKSADPRKFGAITEQTQIKWTTEYLGAHSTPDPEIKKDDTTKETTFSEPGDIVVGLVKLDHRRSKL